MTRILVVEDDRDIGDLVSRYLEKAGFAVELLSSGRDALRAIAERPPDLLILDLMLPHVDGLPATWDRERSRLMAQIDIRGLLEALGFRKVA